jgi:hypothetical protein
MSLQYKDTPDYDYLIQLVRQLDPRADLQPYDWEGDASVYRCVPCASALSRRCCLAQRWLAARALWTSRTARGGAAPEPARI